MGDTRTQMRHDTRKLMHLTSYVPPLLSIFLSVRFPLPPPRSPLPPPPVAHDAPRPLPLSRAVQTGEALPAHRLPWHVDRLLRLPVAVHVAPQELAPSRAHVHGR